MPGSPDGLHARSLVAPIALGRYDVIRPLGHGGMGAVFEAIDRERGTRVALKTLRVQDAAAGVWLKREFRAVADVVHPNLAPVYELGSESGLWFFTMELVRGVSLARWARPDDPEASAPSLPLTRTVVSGPREQDTLRSPGSGAPSEVRVTDRATPVAEAGEEAAAPAVEPPAVTPPQRSIDEIRRVFAALVHGVAALHDAGLRHGDIKPGNVLVRDDGHVVLVDFGLARPVRARDDAGTPSGGTPAFMAPEQFAAGAVGLEADWYAVGATLHAVLTGTLPFGAASLIELQVRKKHHPPTPPHLLWSGVPLDLGELCARLMSPDPAERPALDEILRVLSGEVTAPSTSAGRGRRRTFVGRERELFALERAYGGARAGAGTLVHVHGASGMGKSALLESFLDAVHDVDDALVLRGRCYERETVPYKGFDRILDELSDRLRNLDAATLAPLLPAWSGELGRAFPGLAAVPAIAQRAAAVHVAHDAIELRRRAWVALGDLLAALGKTSPVVLAIDDVQWIDDDSAHLLDALLRRTSRPAPRDAVPAPAGSGPSSARRSPALLVILLFRPEEAGANAALRTHFEMAQALDAAGRRIDVPLSPLSGPEAEELAAAALRAAGVADALERAPALAEEAQGIPFFIEELAHFASRGEAPPERASLDDAIRARVASLTDDERAIVEVVAVAAAPLPQRVVHEAAGLDPGSLAPLLAVRGASLVTWLGPGLDATVSTYHDRIREAVAAGLGERARQVRHLAIGRALARVRGDAPGLIFETIRHLAAAAALIEDAGERLEVARLHAEAGERARGLAAFPLAFDCFQAGIALLPHDAWTVDYPLALRLHVGATDAAYLTARWEVLAGRIADVKAHARSPLDALTAWQAQIDAHVGAQEYVAGVDAGLDVLRQLGVHLRRDPSIADLVDDARATLGSLAALGPDGLLRLPDATDPVVAAATEIQVRMSPAAYFGKPALLPVIACNLVRTSIERGVSAATPYALALFGIVLNTMGLHEVAHDYGQLAMRLLDRWPSRRLEAATRHILNDLVCCWVVPLSTVLEPLREVFDLGCRTGDYEYASYAAHGYVHNAIYAARPLGPLVTEALALGKEMRALGQVNALHVYTPFEQLLRGLTGALADPSSLDGDGFDEQSALRDAEASGSRSGVFVVAVVMGLARWTFGRVDDACAAFERARAYLDAAPSVWHVPILHQHGALAACAAWDGADPERRAALRATAEESLHELRKLAAIGRVNFRHRVDMVEGALARIDGHPGAARAAFDRAIAGAQAGGWLNDVALANELAAAVEADAEGARRRLRAARTAYAAWGATAKAERLARG